MPRYDYFCPANGRLIEARHSMTTTLRTWGELCSSAEIDRGTTPADSRVDRVISPAAVLGTRRSVEGSGSHARSHCCGKAGCHG